MPAHAINKFLKSHHSKQPREKLVSEERLGITVEILVERSAMILQFEVDLRLPCFI